MTNYLLAPMTHGPWVALGAALLVTPIGLILIAGVFERRLLRPREQYFAFILGDPLLATAVAVLVSINTPKALASLNVDPSGRAVCRCGSVADVRSLAVEA